MKRYWLRAGWLGSAIVTSTLMLGSGCAVSTQGESDEAPVATDARESEGEPLDDEAAQTPDDDGSHDTVSRPRKRTLREEPGTCFCGGCCDKPEG
jgi:hypothetical protein